MEDFNKMFEDFCNDHNLHYDFERLGGSYKSSESHRAFIMWSILTNNGR